MSKLDEDIMNLTVAARLSFFPNEFQFSPELQVKPARDPEETANYYTQ